MPTWSPSAARTLVLPRQAGQLRGLVPATVALRFVNKRPTARLDYSIDLRNWIDTSDTLATASAAVVPNVPGGLTAEDTVITGSIVTGWLDRGVANTDYVVTFSISSEAARVFSVPVSVLVK